MREGRRRFPPWTDAFRAPRSHHGDMSAATFTPASARHGLPSGATSGTDRHRRSLGGALLAIKVFAGAAFDVMVLGEFEEEAGVRRR